MITIALLLSGTVAAHQATVEHRGQRYEVSHQARVETRAKTVGVAVGARLSLQRCRWTATVRVERTIARDGAATGMTGLLPASRVVDGDRHGACPRTAAAPDRRVRVAAEELVAAARDDRAATLAAIDAAHALAAN